MADKKASKSKEPLQLKTKVVKKLKDKADVLDDDDLEKVAGGSMGCTNSSATGTNPSDIKKLKP